MPNQATAELNLVVITAENVGASLAFYEALGLQLDREQHGNGPVHYAAVFASELVFEIYPAANDRAVSNVRLGFTVDSIERVISGIERTGGSVAVPAKQGKWGLRATLMDPDGNKVDVVQRSSVT